MSTSNFRATVALASFLSAVSSPSLSWGNEQSLEEVAQVVVRLLKSVESEFDCIIKIVSIEEIPKAYQSAGKYFVRFRGSGSRCAKASDMLNRRGKAAGLVVFRRVEPGSRNERGQKPFFDLVYEIDPPI